MDETASPRDSKVAHLSPESLGEDDVATAKEAFATAREALRERNQLAQLIAEASRESADLTQQHVGAPQSSPHANSAKGQIKRARSLSPKSSRRIHHVIPPAGATSAVEPPAGKAGKQDDKEKGKPARSALRGAKPSRGDLHVTISPHSSEESFSSSDTSLSKVAPGSSGPLERREGGVEGQPERRISQSERPKSMEELESHKFSLQAFPGDLHSGLLVRHGSTRSEQLDYSEVASFLKPGRLQKLAQVRREQDGSDSTPEVRDM